MNLPFVINRKERWQRLNELLKKIAKNKLSSLSKAELIEFSVLYRQVTSDLALAKTQKLPREVISFLNDLTARAYNQLYRSQKTRWQQIKELIIIEYPQLIRQNWKIILFSLGIILLGWLFGFIGYNNGPDVVSAIIPEQFGQRLVEHYETNTWFNEPLAARPYVSSTILFNNIQVAINAFAGGMILGTFTVYALFFNGFLLGVLSGVFHKQGYLLSFWAMILPHGVIELTAIVLAAASGFLLTYTILFPGQYSRSDALRLYGRTAVKLISGTIFLFLVAGLIEGYLSTISTEVIPELYRLVFAAFTGILLLWYFNLGRNKTPRRGIINKLFKNYQRIWRMKYQSEPELNKERNY
ncbi:MAG TPA: stage II sporulation protein M [Bacillota bacterium]|nr:stage II sporulation protein M [Bacillota bacterium]HOL09206.1 stage II sporulation protein M [Bacillota bacterium]HPO97030.1 stage II sporulation protein M [Bacillota bacterium]